VLFDRNWEAKSLTDRVINHWFVQGVRNEQKKIEDVVMDRLELNGRETHYKNFVGKTIDKEEDDKSLLSHLMQGYEAAFLKTVVVAQKVCLPLPG